jgi:hypothetical protein
MKMLKMNTKQSKPIEYSGTLWFQCVQCGEWSNHIGHITNNQKLFDSMLNEHEIGETIGWSTYCMITINNVSKPYQCGGCVNFDHGTMKNNVECVQNNKTTQQLMQMVEMHQYECEMVKSWQNVDEMVENAYENDDIKSEHTWNALKGYTT